MKHLAFVDPKAPAPYDHRSYDAGPLPGTQGALLAVAEGLADDWQVSVFQNGRNSVTTSPAGVTYLPWTGDTHADVDVVVLSRRWDLLKSVTRQFPRARRVLWLQVITDNYLRRYQQALISGRWTVLGVSRFHAASLGADLEGTWLRSCLQRAGLRSKVPVEWIYNPIGDELAPDQTAVDPNKLVFFSSPHKGLDQVAAAFKDVVKRRPTAKLFVANPGYRASGNWTDDHNIVNLGPIPHRHVIEHLREAFCLFYPQTTFPETFGMVLAEANAVGTPVLTHPIGAAGEILNDPCQVVDCTSTEFVADTLMSWYESGRPSVSLRDDLRLSCVLCRWRNLLE